MEISVISDAISSIASSSQSLAYSNFLNRPHNVLSAADKSSSDPPPPPFRISASSRPSTTTVTKRRPRSIRRVKRKILADGDDGENGFFAFGGAGDFGGGNGYFGSGGGGKGWGFGGYGGPNWDEFSDNSVSDPAWDFVYEVLCWISMSNCLHFALKKVVRSVAGGFGDRGKVPVC